MAIIFLGWDDWFFFILLPFFLTDCLGAYLFYAQHNFPGVSFKENIEWSYDNAALQSSSYMDLPKFLHWVTANIGYHHVHHMNSRIPFYRLPEVMEKIPELKQVKRTTLKPKDVMECLRLKIWDQENNKMIPVELA
jgi:omega-6 fatty acid desaturase (delta-12 desaturase)